MTWLPPWLRPRQEVMHRESQRCVGAGARGVRPGLAVPRGIAGDSSGASIGSIAAAAGKPARDPRTPSALVRPLTPDASPDLVVLRASIQSVPRACADP